MPNFYVLTVSWQSSRVYPPLVEGVLGMYSDWIRLTDSSWIAYSDHSAQDIGKHVQGALNGQHFFLVRADVDQLWGLAPAWVWTWLYQRQGGAKPGTLPPPQNPVPVLALGKG